MLYNTKKQPSTQCRACGTTTNTVHFEISDNSNFELSSKRILTKYLKSKSDFFCGRGVEGAGALKPKQYGRCLNVVPYK